ncbi:uncharacterized protein LOC114420478 [Glycine soja]|uniref:uncharacterized protein LOC114420478 n=1 Tax=Glycine soja TaxID=3848 RepID=UPI00103DB3C9|nr:uncharacterized protein LOC114420478 [Glycine soja]
MCRIFDEDQREKAAFYRNANASHGKEKKSVTHSRAKPYSAPPGKYGNHSRGQRTSEGHHLAGGSSQPVNRVSQPASRGNGGAPATPTRCAKCGRMGHFARECPDNDVTCFNYRGKGHLSTNCPHARREKMSGSLNNQNGRPKTTGRVFALSGADAAQSDDLIQGMCFISQVPLVVLYDSGVTHSFISRVSVEKLALPVSSLKFDLIVNTPASGSVLTSDVCLQSPVLISNRQFLIDLVVLPLSQIDVILGDIFLSANQVEASLREDAQVYMILASMSVETKTPVSDIPLVREFPEVFEEVSRLPPEREVEFSIDLVPGTGPISIAPHRMSPVELSELKKQL